MTRYWLEICFNMFSISVIIYLCSRSSYSTW